MKYEKKILLYLILMLFSGMAGGAGPVNGVTELTLISDFSRKDTGEWTLKDGGNLKLKLDFGAKLTKDKKITGLKAEIMRIDPTKSSSLFYLYYGISRRFRISQFYRKAEHLFSFLL